MRSARRRRASGAIIITAGFRETGPEGAALEQRIVDMRARRGIRVIGPNCLGVMNPIDGLNATFAAGMPAAGSVGFVSQCGALLTAVLDWSARRGRRLLEGRLAGLDGRRRLGRRHLLPGRRSRTPKSILIYMETIGDARAFLSAAREVALTKPIAVIKPGRTAEASRAAASHTGSLTGSDEVLDAAFRRVGVLRVERISDLFGIADVLAKQPRPQGPNLTDRHQRRRPGGARHRCADRRRRPADGPVRRGAVRPTTRCCPSVWSHNNPVDIIGDAEPARYARALEIAAADPAADGMLVILTPQAMTDPTETARALTPYAHIKSKPVLASWMGGRDVEEGCGVCCATGHPHLRLSRHGRAHVQLPLALVAERAALYETPTLAVEDGHGIDRVRCRADVIAAVRADGRTILTEDESKQVLAAYGVPITRDASWRRRQTTRWPRRETIGYPVVVKLYSHTISSQERRRRGSAEPGRRRRRCARRSRRSRRPSPRHAAPSTSTASPSSR